MHYKKIFFLLVLFAFVMPQFLSAQPVISYLIPDIGTPGMNTYMEIIAPHDSVGEYGNDGFYLNNRTDIIQVVCTNPSDTQYVRFGPCVVSWSGRMIATQVFVLPWVKANSSDWQNGIKIPVQVLFDGDLSNVDTFYIVSPQFLSPSIVFTSAGTLGSGSGWGQRSRRGTMIVDSLILAAVGVYNFSTKDCDPFTYGEQGYLPFILISKGRISVASSSVLDISGSGIDAGAGGGGGGNGLICETRGGNGFTGGGGNAHWYNACTGAPPPGDGTGYLQDGLNGVIGGESSFQNEGGGGGTGHPFGAGGDAGYFPSGTGKAPGSYGGGKGGQECCAPQEGGGGGGGFTFRGFDGGVVLTHTSAGNLQGNTSLVPVSGGSGGGGGNVNTGDAAGIGAGSAGAGGGALVLYGKQTSIKGTVRSKGADGLNSINNCGAGGAGSGGAIICGAKVSLGVSKADVPGGIGGLGIPVHSGQDGGGGSVGRVRFDGPAPVAATVTSRASKYTGPSTDVSDTVTKTFTLTGSSDGSEIRIFVKPLYGQWSQVSLANFTQGFGLWKTTITLPGTDSIYLLAAAQKIPKPIPTASHTADPSWVLSQAAANILYVKCPADGLQVSDSAIDFGTVSLCADVFDTILIANNGCNGSTLSNSIGDASIGLSFERQTKSSISVQSKDTIVVRLHPKNAGASTTVLTVHTSFGDISIPLKWVGDASAPSLSLSRSSISIGRISICDERFDTLILKNIGCDVLSLSDSIADAASGFSIFKRSQSSLGVQSGDTIIVHFKPNRLGVFTSSLHLHYGSRDTVLNIDGEVIHGEQALQFTPPTIDFGSFPRCHSVLDTIIITSAGCDTLTISASIDNPSAGISFIRQPKNALASGQNDTIIILFSPGRAGAISANILLSYPGGDSSIAVTAFGVNDSTPLVFEVPPIIHSVQCDPKPLIITLENTACDSLTLTDLNITGVDASDFSIPFDTLGIATNVIKALTGSFDPKDSGMRHATLHLHFLRIDGSVIDTTLELLGNGNQENVRIVLPAALLRVQYYTKISIPITSLDSIDGVVTVFEFTLRLHTDLLTPTGVDGSAGLFAGATVDNFNIYHDSLFVRLRLASPIRIMPGLLCIVDCTPFVSDTLSTAISLARTNFGTATSAIQCLSTTHPDSVIFDLDPQCGDKFLSHYLALKRVPSIDGIVPNPSSGIAKISYSLPTDSYVKIELFDQLGAKVRALHSANERMGIYQKPFDISDMPSGLYFFRLSVGETSQLRSFQLSK